MASQEKLRQTYPQRATPNMFGHHFNERPQPDAFGRRAATPLEIQQTMIGEFSQSPQIPILPYKIKYKKRIIPEYELLRQARQKRKIEARLRKNHRNNTPKSQGT